MTSEITGPTWGFGAVVPLEKHNVFYPIRSRRCTSNPIVFKSLSKNRLQNVSIRFIFSDALILTTDGMRWSNSPWICDENEELGLETVTLTLKLANFTDDQFSGNTHTHSVPLSWTKQSLHLRLPASTIMLQPCNQWTRRHTRVPSVLMTNTLAVQCCPVHIATSCLGNQQGWRRLFPDKRMSIWVCVCVCGTLI